jgi:hypothetical protein
MRTLKELNQIAYQCNITGEPVENYLTKEEMYEYALHTKEENMKLNTMLPKEEYIKQQNAQRALNKAQYIDALKHVNNWKDFYKITKTVDPIMKSDNKKKFYFFPQGGMKEYWATRKAKAAELAAQRETAVKTYLDASYLKKLEGNTYEQNIQERNRIQSDASLPIRSKQQLIAKIDQYIVEDYNKNQKLAPQEEIKSSQDEYYDNAVAYEENNYYDSLDNPESKVA